MPVLSPKDPAEKFAIAFDFSALLESITTVSCSAAARGTDTDPSQVLSGLPQVNGNVVLQRVRGGIADNDYVIRCEATNDTETYVLVGTLPVRTAN